jgi:hypothetical protein
MNQSADPPLLEVKNKNILRKEMFLPAMGQISDKIVIICQGPSQEFHLGGAWGWGNYSKILILDVGWKKSQKTEYR